MSEETKTIEQLVDELLGAGESFSPYRVSQIASIIMERPVLPQVVYSYVRQNFIVASKNSTGKWSVARSEAIRWIAKYVRNNKK